MSTKTTQRKDGCGVCGKGLRDTTITHEEKRGSHLYVFEHVPVQICGACGETWIEENTLQEIDRLIKEGKPTRKVETPVYDFPSVPT